MESLSDILNGLSQLDISDISLFFAALAGMGYSVVKEALKPIWVVVERPLGFVLSTLVVVSLWVALLRIHVSLSFNVDKELFDNLLWLSAITYTPYYIIKYSLTEQLVLFFVRTIELLLDLFIFSWFEEKAKANRLKWRQRLGFKD